MFAAAQYHVESEIELSLALQGLKIFVLWTWIRTFNCWQLSLIVWWKLRDREIHFDPLQQIGTIQIRTIFVSKGKKQGVIS
jgi:hypothetical protein